MRLVSVDRRGAASGSPRYYPRVTRTDTPVAPLPAAERARILDFEHRKRARSVWPRVLSLRYLTTALGRLGRGTAAVEAAPVPRPPRGRCRSPSSATPR